MPLHPERDVAHFQQFGAGRLPGLLGITITEVGEGVIKAQLPLRPELLAPNGYLHAGTVVSLADTLAGYGCLAMLPEGASSFTTIELKANFLGTAREGTIQAEARGLHLGRTTQVWDATVSAAGRSIAVFRCTQLVLYPR
jgi:1,4-dihydroxy-2-naphthoyl-CoA hydrolase